MYLVPSGHIYFASAGMSTLVDYVRLTRSGGSGLPQYLKRTCPFGLRHGRRLKTKMRLGAHQLQGSLARMIPRHVRRPADFHCKCCSMGVDETAKHALFECRCHVDIRRDFVARVEAVCPTFRSMSTDVRFRLVMSDETPKEIDSHLYRFLIQLFASRERKLASSGAT